MARVNLEEELFGEGRLDKLSALLSEPLRSAIGLLAMLWRESQKELKNSATKDEICDYCRAYPEDEKEKVFNALLGSGWVISQKNGLFKIIGNEKQVENLRAYKERIKKINEKKRKKILGKENNDLEGQLSETCDESRNDSGNESCDESRNDSRASVATSVGSNAMQFNAKQFNKKNTSYSPPNSSKLEVGPLQEFQEFSDLLGEIKHEKQRTWLQLYEDPDWMKRELLKMQSWLLDNPRRKPKGSRGFSKFISSWLERGWEAHRKTISINRSKPKVGHDVLKKLKAGGFNSQASYDWSEEERDFVMNLGGVIEIGKFDPYKMQRHFGVAS